MWVISSHANQFFMEKLKPIHFDMDVLTSIVIVMYISMQLIWMGHDLVVELLTE